MQVLYTTISKNKGMIYRDRDEIFYDILNVVRGTGECSIHTIVLSCRLGYHAHRHYITFLLSRGLLSKRDRINKSRLYSLTDKGRRYLELFEKLNVQVRPRGKVGHPDIYIDAEDVAERYGKHTQWRSNEE